MSADFNSPWTIRLPVEDAEHLGKLRLTHGLSALVDGASVWLRGEYLNEDLNRQIRSIPNAERFRILADQQLTRPDETVPCARLPDGPWQPLRSWISVTLPVAGFAAQTDQRVMLRLVRSSRAMLANLMQTSWERWRAYAITAPAVRLARLGFAVSDNSDVLIRGTPLPPIPGRFFIEDNGVIVPIGWQFEPFVGSTIVRQLLNLDEAEIALFSEDGSFELLLDTAFVQATRSAVRMTFG
ncbi:MAG: hypothetical protein WCH39_18080 [Schlesneria sp.]